LPPTPLLAIPIKLQLAPPHVPPVMLQQPAHVAGHAVYAATYAAKAATYAAGPTDAGVNTAKERNWQFQHLLDLGDNQ
jgi:hypothetical protein